MILDERLEFGDALAVTGTADVKVAIGDVIDLGSYLGGTAGATELAPDVALGEDLYFVITTDTEVITGGIAGTVKFSLNSNATADLAGTPTEHFVTDAIVTDDSAANDARLNAGGVICAVKLPLGSYQRYLVLGEDIDTTTITAGKINAFLTKDFSKWKALANAVNG